MEEKCSRAQFESGSSGSRPASGRRTNILKGYSSFSYSALLLFLGFPHFLRLAAIVGITSNFPFAHWNTSKIGVEAIVAFLVYYSLSLFFAFTRRQTANNGRNEARNKETNSSNNARRRLCKVPRANAIPCKQKIGNSAAVTNKTGNDIKTN